MVRPLIALLLFLLVVLPGQAASPLDRATLDNTMQGIVSRYRLDGAALWVSHNGQPVHRRFYAGYTPATRVPIASASKWLSALVLARLIERGTLRLDTTVGEWFPEAPTDKRGITLAQLFSHTSGLPGEESGCIANPLTTLQACAAQILNGPLQSPPGTAFAYGGLSMQVAGAMAERATGRSWSRLFSDEVAGPLGLTATDYAAGSANPGLLDVPNPRIAGGIRSTLDDYARVVAMWQADGRVGASHFLQAATLRALEVDRTKDLRRLDVPPGVGSGEFGYAFGFWRLPTGRAGNPWLFSSPGAFGFTPWVDGSAGSAGVFMVQDSNTRLAPEVEALQRSLAAALAPIRTLQEVPAWLHWPNDPRPADGQSIEPSQRSTVPNHGAEHHRGHPGGRRGPGDVCEPECGAADRRATVSTAGKALHGVHPPG